MVYAHTQTVPKKVMAAATAAGLLVGFSPPGIVLRLIALSTMGAMAATFRSLTVEVDDQAVSLRFGDGLVTRRFDLKTITAAQKVRTTVIQGWGIHYVGNGWLYNIYGLDAVELRFNSGKRALIGSDDADNLVAAVNDALRTAHA